MKSSKELLQKIKQEIDKGYERYRMDRELAEWVESVDSPLRMRKLPKYYKYAFEKPAFREVEPKNIGFTFNLKNDPQTISIPKFKKLGIALAEKEYCCIVKSLLENAGHIVEAETEGTITLPDLVSARGKTNIPDERIGVVIPEKILSKIEKEIVGILTKPKSEEQRVPCFVGWITTYSLWIYRAQFLEDEAVLFVKSRIIVKNTPHIVNYDDEKKPKKLMIEKWCSSAPLIDDAVVKIKL